MRRFISEKQRLSIQLVFAVFMATMGMVLLFISFFFPPMGVIDASVLAAIGEIFSFSGAVMGIDYSYRFKHYKIDERYRHTGFAPDEGDEDMQ